MWFTVLQSAKLPWSYNDHTRPEKNPHVSLVYDVNRGLDVRNRKRQQRRLLWSTIVEIPIHIGPAERPFNWIDRPILVAIKLLKTVVGQFKNIRVRNASTKMIPNGVIALRTFQYAVVHEVGSWLHNGFRRLLLLDVHTPRVLRPLRLELCPH